MIALYLLDLMAKRSNARRSGPVYESKGIKTAFLLGPNYAAGKDMLAGVTSTFKGKIIGQEFTKWPDQLDFSAELTKAKDAKPDAIFAFYPGAAGAQFLLQYPAREAERKGQIRWTLRSKLNELRLPRQKDAGASCPWCAAMGQ